MHCFPLTGYPPCSLDCFVEEEKVRAGQGGHQLAGQLHRQSLLPLRKWVLEKASMKTKLNQSFLAFISSESIILWTKLHPY